MWPEFIYKRVMNVIYDLEMKVEDLFLDCYLLFISHLECVYERYLPTQRSLSLDLKEVILMLIRDVTYSTF